MCFKGWNADLFIALSRNVLQETNNIVCLFCRSHLVPTFGFGQNDVFSRQPKISFLQSYQTGCSKWEKWAKIFIKSCLVVPFARFCIMPDSRPVTVVGEFSKNFSPFVCTLALREYLLLVPFLANFLRIPQQIEVIIENIELQKVFSEGN